MTDDNNKKSEEKVNKIECQFCKEVEVMVPDDVEVGDLLECENCAAEVEVISLEPFRVRMVVEEK